MLRHRDVKSAIHAQQDLLSNYPSVTCSHLNVQANMLDALLSMRLYDEAQQMIDRYECMTGQPAHVLVETDMKVGLVNLACASSKAKMRTLASII